MHIDRESYKFSLCHILQKSGNCIAYTVHYNANCEGPIFLKESSKRVCQYVYLKCATPKKENLNILFN